MKKMNFSDYMKILFIIIIFMCLKQGVYAPTKDYPLRRLVINRATEYAEFRFHEMEFQRFINDLGRSESGNSWQCINCIGCFGEWQFAESTVHYLGYRSITLKKFRADPDIFPRELQKRALKSLIKLNMAFLKDYEDFIGDTIRGVLITKSGIIAASHLGGAGSVKLFLASGGRIDKEDVLGTSVKDYIRKFSNYDID